METIITAARDIPREWPATASDGAVHWDPLHLGVIDSSGATVDNDLTAVTWELTVSDEQGGVAELEATTAASLGDTGVYVEDASTGCIHIAIEADDVATLGAGVHWYEVRATIPAGHAYLPPGPRVIARGPLTIEEDAVG
jgi:hypothetical protein